MPLGLGIAVREGEIFFGWGNVERPYVTNEQFTIAVVLCGCSVCIDRAVHGDVASCQITLTSCLYSVGVAIDMYFRFCG